MNIYSLLLASESNLIDDLIKIPQDISKEFDVHTNLLISQTVAFLIVCFVLKQFAFKPLLGMLEERKKRIADGEEKLKSIEKQLAESEATKNATIDQANSDAKRLINEAKESAAKIGEEKTQEAIASAQNILVKAQETAQSEKAKASAEIKQEFGRLIALTTANVTGKVLNEDDKQRINQEALATLNN